MNDFQRNISMRQRMADLQGFEKLMTKLSMIRNVALICKFVVRKLIEI